MLDSNERGIFDILLVSTLVDSDFRPSSFGDFMGISSSNIRESESELEE